MTEYQRCFVCTARLRTDEAHTYHDEECPARPTGDIRDCTCGGLDECHPECCPTCITRDFPPARHL